jgi:hypothetical protein
MVIIDILQMRVSMPLQNRVNPYGQIARGTLMGNRGCLHDTQQHPLRQYQTKRWIICVLDFKGRKRNPMPPSITTRSRSGGTK